MSQTIKFSISDENYEELKSRLAENQTVQDYLRELLFPGQSSQITPEIAAERALEKYSSGATFTVPEIFGDEWNLPIGHAGIFGERFAELVEREYSGRIRAKGIKIANRAVYEIV